MSAARQQQLEVCFLSVCMEYICLVLPPEAWLLHLVGTASPLLWGQALYALASCISVEEQMKLCLKPPEVKVTEWAFCVDSLLPFTGTGVGGVEQGQ
jgi:hypothetical protein